LIEKAARGMRHVKRAVRADLARFKAYTEMQEVETGAWRGVIHDGELVEDHDEKYDKDREYAEFEDIHDRESSHSPQPQEQKKQTSSSRQKKQTSSRRSGSSPSGSRRRGAGSSSKTSSSARSSSGRSRSTKKRSRAGSSRKRSTSRS
jgi:hypothetical protein